MTTYTVQLEPIITLSDEQFYQLCVKNHDLKFERNARGDLVIMAPIGGETGNRNAGLVAQLWNWNEQSQMGKVFDSSTGFSLPNGGDRSPDAAWVSNDRWDALLPEQRKRFLPLCPEFLVELLSPSDNRSDVQTKMREYQENGAKLGWLIDREAKEVEIYRAGASVELLSNPPSLSGEDILVGFVLDLRKIW